VISKQRGIECWETKAMLIKWLDTGSVGYEELSVAGWRGYIGIWACKRRAVIRGSILRGS
jgi:hypothetical protein